MNKLKQTISSCALVMLFGGCQYTAQTPGAEQAQPLPNSYGQATETVADAASKDPWWLSFERSDLNALQNQAMSGNLDLSEAWARLREAQAQAVIAGADLYPTLDGSGSWTTSHTHGRNTGSAGDGFGLGAEIGYEVDLWGRIKAQSRSAQALAEASQFDVQSTALLLSGEVADTWITILAQESGLRLLQQQVDTNKTQLELVLLRFGNGQSNALDVLQQKQLLAQVETIVPQVERQIRLSRHQLALLLGQPANESFADEELHDMPTMPPTPSIGIPSDLLMQRPDLRAAYLSLDSAEWNVAEAKADRLPRVTLSADATTTASAFSDLFDSWSASFLAGLAQPLFDAGRRQAEVERQLAIARQALSQYRNTVLTAYKEVMDALVNEEWLRKELAALDREQDAAQQEFSEAQLRYMNGLTDYLDVTSSLASLQSLQRERISLLSTLLQARVELHLAIGGELPLENPQPEPILSPEDTIPLVPVLAELGGAPADK